MKELTSLTPDQRTVLETMACLYHATNRTQLAEVLRDLQLYRHDGKVFTTMDLAGLLDPLVASKVARVDDNRYACDVRSIDMLTLDARRSGILERVRGNLPRLPVSEWWQKGYQELLRALRLHVLAGDEPSADLVLDEMKRRHKDDVAFESPIITVFGHARPALVAHLPARFEAEVLYHTSLYCVQELPDASPFVSYLLRRIESAGQAADPWIVQGCVELLLLRGDFEQAEKIIDSNTSQSLFLALGGWLLLIRGDRIGAERRFAQASKTGTKADRGWTHGPTGLFRIFSSLSGQGSTSWGAAAKAAKAAKAARSTGTSPLAVLFQAMLTLTSGLLGERQTACEALLRSLDQELIPLARRDVVVLWHIAALYWLSEPPPKAAIEALQSISANARTTGWFCVAAEADELLFRTADDREAGARAAAFRASHGVTTLLDVLITREPWQHALEALKACANDVGPAPAEARIAWLVTLRQPYYTSISAIEQRRQGQGWTKGRSIAMKRMCLEPGSIPHATDADRRVFALIRHEVIRTHRYPEEKFTLDTTEALRELGGHPAVFVEDHGRTLVEVVVRRPVLRVGESEDGRIVIDLDPPTSEWEQLQFDDERVITVCRAADSDRRVSAAIGAGIELPPRGRAEAIDVLSALAGVVEIQSDIEVEARMGETVPSDGRIRFRLTREGLGLDVRVRVGPLGGKGPLFFPGNGQAVVFAEVEGRRLQTTRDLERESEDFARCLERLSLLDRLDPDLSGWRSGDLATTLSLLSELQVLGDSIVVEWPRGAPIRVSRRLGPRSLRMSIHSLESWFEADGQLQVDEDLVIDMQTLLLRVASQPGTFIELGPDQFLALTEDFRRRLDRLVALGHAHKGKWRLHAVTPIHFPDLGDGLRAFKSDAAWKRRCDEAEAARARDWAVPSDLRAELRDYQIDGFRWLSRLAHWGLGACLADDMGLGKTVQAIALALRLAPAGPVLVVAPTSVCMNWRDEIDRFSPSLRALVFGPGDRKETMAEATAGTVLICSYTLLQQNRTLLQARAWEMVVLDEAQAVKNAATERAKAVRGLKARFRLATTGTPVENDLEELWSLFRFLVPGLLGSAAEFRKTYGGGATDSTHPHAMRRLKALLRPFLLRRTKAAVLEELPPRTDVTRRVVLSEREMAVYEAVRREAQERAATFSGQPHEAAQLLTAITKLRRAACHARFVVPDAPMQSAKLEALGELIDELHAGGHRALVFSQFVDHLEIIRQYVQERGVAIQYLDGSTPMAERAASVSAWQQGVASLFLISLRAGGVGLNLTAADYVVHMDPWWNPAVEDQASDRTHRIGQERPVTVVRLITEGTIEEKIMALHRRKREIAAGLLEGTQDAARMSVDELLDLIREPR